MKRLQKDKIEQLSKYLQAVKLDSELLPEILDHLACEAEERLWDGKSFEQAFNGIVETADSQTLLNLSIDHQNLLAMEKSLNDIVFEGRNKLYGAYQLRKGYGQTMQRSVLLGVTLFLLMVMLPNLYARLVPELKKDEVAYVVEIKDITIMADEKPVPPPPVKEVIKPLEKTIKSTLFEVLPDEKVTVENTPPATEDLEHATPGQQTADGIADLDVIVPPAAESGSGKISPIELAPEKEVEFTIVEQNPEFVGGNAAMAEFLQKNLRYPSAASRANVQGRVFVQFTVGSDGKIENVQPIKGIGFGCDEEAVRVIKLMKDWKPGKQGGVPVRVRFTLPIMFQMN